MAGSRRRIRRAWSLPARACWCPAPRSSTRPIERLPSPPSGAPPRRSDGERRRLALRLVVALRLALAPCVSACGAELREARPAPLVFPTPEPEAAASRERERELANELENVLALVTRTRGLPLEQPPQRVAVPRTELVEHALAWLDAHTPEPTRRAEQALLTALELVPAGFDWRAALRQTLALRLLAFYDSDSGTIWLDAGLAPAARRRTLAHELVHALADRHYALGARLAAGEADARAALLSIAEGDATLLVERLDAAGLLPRDAAAPELATGVLPGVLERSLLATYVDGLAVVRRVFEGGGWADVNALYAAPPPSTHALLAPDFPHAASPTPTLEPFGPPPGTGWLASGATFGEQALRVILEEWLSPQRAFELARGWQGDRLSLFERGAQRALVWEIRAAGDAAQAAEDVLREGLGLARAASRRASATACRAHQGGGVVGLSRRGQSLLIGAWSDVPARDACALLADWMNPPGGDGAEAIDPGPRRLIGPD